MKIHYLFCLLFWIVLYLPLNAEANLEFTDCFLEDCGTFIHDQSIQFAYLYVPENRDDPDSRTLKIAVLIMKSKSDQPLEDPLIYLNGGPGGMTFSRIERWKDHYLRDQRDLIFFDYRGVGLSEPEFCIDLQLELWEIGAADLTVKQFKEEKKNLTLNCFEQLKAEGIDLSKYNSTQAVLDLEDLRHSLGIDQWNLYGISYGTRIAQAYMKNHPKALRSVILDSPVPVNFSLLDSYLDSYRNGIEEFFNYCNQSPVCSKRFPVLEEQFFRAIESLKEEPLTIYSSNVPGGEVVVNFYNAHLAFHQLLYVRDFYPVLPWLFESLYNRDKVVFSNLVESLFSRSQEISHSMYIIKCFYDYGLLIDFQKADEEGLLKDALAYFDADQLVYAQIDFIEQDSAIIHPFDTNIPTLILTGANDPITPSDFGRRVNEYLTLAYWFDFPGVGHGVSFGPDCARQLTSDFVDNPSVIPDYQCMDEIRENPIQWLDAIYHNPHMANFSKRVIIERNPYIVGSLLSLVLLLFISLARGLTRRFKDNKTQMAPFIRRRNTYFQLTASLSVVFFALLFWYISFTVQNHGILALLGLVNESRWIFFLVYFILLGMAFSLNWYIQSYYQSSGFDKVFYGLMMFVFFVVAVLMVLFKMFP
ncbi:MAG: alpha/beta fold hydrolase [Saprospirales bacterium]|nr:MAG: alpha/beta fold hydrolase [Saprospirales bacterium]